MRHRNQLEVEYVGRRGRKRRGGDRQPNGQHSKRQRPIDPKAIAAAMPHRRGVPADVRHDPIAEDEIGKLRLKDILTGIQHDAALKFRDHVRAYHAVISAPNQDPPSIAGSLLGRGGGGVLSEQQARDRRDTYMRAYEALESGAGNRGARAVSHWVVYNRGDMPLEYLRLGLTALAKHYGLTSSQSRGSARNRSWRSTPEFPQISPAA
jgi:hypothetical protein